MPDNKRLSINYIPVIPSDYIEIQLDDRIFKKYSEGYSWYPEPPPKIYRRGLITIIKLGYASRNATMKYLQTKRENGEFERIMFDSGGFQMFSDPSFTIDKLVTENLWLYKKFDFADAYVMPDNPPLPEDPRPVMEEKVERTIRGTLTIFDQLPEKIQLKSMPVFHVRTTYDIDHQYDVYKHIINISKLVCYAIPGSRKRLDLSNMKLLKYLRDLLPNDVKIHALGVASAPAIYCMEQLGIYSYDAVSPIIAGGLGLVQFVGETVDLSIKKPERSVCENTIKRLQEETKHRCPFCDDYTNLLHKYRYRRLHNLLVYDELDWHFRNMTMEQFQIDYPGWYDILTKTMSDNQQTEIDLYSNNGTPHSIELSSNYMMSKQKRLEKEEQKRKKKYQPLQTKLDI